MPGRWAAYDSDTNPDDSAKLIVELHKRQQDERDFKGFEFDEDCNLMNPQSTVEDKKTYGMGLYQDEYGTYYDKYGRECDKDGNRY